MSALKISQNAHKRLLEVLSSNSFLLISVNTGGCNGFSYSFEVHTIQPQNSTIVSSNPNVCISNSALEHINGSVLEFEKNDIGTAFFSVQNPNATSKCGCGNSFSTF